MKWIRIVFLLVSFIVLLLVSYAIINGMISYKYEIEESSRLDKIDIKIAACYLKSQITWLWCFLGYVGITIIFLFNSILDKKK